MIAWRWLIAPWVAAHRSARWLMIGLTALGILISAAVGVLSGGLHPATVAAFPLVVVVFLTWLLFLPNMLSLLLVARNLCLPGMRRDVVASLFLYALLSIVAPALVLACVGAHPLVVMLIFALGAGFGMLYAITPWYMNFVFCALPWLIPNLPAAFGLPSPHSPGFMLHASVAVLLLLLLTLWRWHQLLQPGGIRTKGMRRPLIMGLNQTLHASIQGHNPTGASGLVTRHSELLMLRRRPAWMQPRADLRHSGPGANHRPHTLRIALGAGYLPRRLRDHVHTTLASALPLLLGAAILPWMLTATGSNVHDPWKLAGLLIVGGGGLLLNFWLPLVTGGMLTRRFTRINGELPLLALLPGLGPTAAVKRDLFKTCLFLPLRAQAVATIMLMLVALTLHLHGNALLLVLVAQLGSMLWLGATVLDSLSGQLLSLWVRVPVGMLTIMLFILSCVVALITLGATPRPAAHLIVSLALAAWVPLGVALLWIGRRGWRLLQRSPHPFMPAGAAGM